MTSRFLQRTLVHASIAIFTLLICASWSTAQSLAPTDMGYTPAPMPLNSPMVLAPASSPAAIQPMATAVQPMPVEPATTPLAAAVAELESGPRNTASYLPSSTDDPGWIDGAVIPASYNMRTLNPAAAAPDGFKVGSISIKPYGILWGDMIYASSRMFPGHFNLWVESAEKQGESSFVVDARRSRVGVDIAGPEVDIFGGMVGGGKVEVDFFGGFVVPNQTDVRLRHVYWQAVNEDRKFLIGETWDVISPLLPSTINFSVNWAVGNIGFRRTQFRYERYLHLSDDVVITLQGALAENVIQDFSSGSLADGVIREGGNWPMLLGRSAVTFGGPCHRPWTIGVSGHVGETGFDFTKVSPGPLQLPPQDDARFQEWSVNLDFTLPVSERLGFHGEMFTGTNLSNVLGGIVQGVCPCKRVPIRSTGGWAEVWFDWNSCVTSNFGFGIDDPDDSDSLVGRTYNRTIYANTFVQLTDNLRTGFEVAAWKTLYHNTTLNEPDPNDRIAYPTAPGESTVLEWTVQYRF